MRDFYSFFLSLECSRYHSYHTISICHRPVPVCTITTCNTNNYGDWSPKSMEDTGKKEKEDGMCSFTKANVPINGQCRLPKYCTPSANQISASLPKFTQTLTQVKHGIPKVHHHKLLNITHFFGV